MHHRRQGSLSGIINASKRIKWFASMYFKNIYQNNVSYIFIGPMVWYQKFEYAISHWLQKATEHTIGCVLCSPGCFSLFRGSALMDDNVMHRYTTLPTEASHYVQYDQGLFKFFIKF